MTSQKLSTTWWCASVLVALLLALVAAWVVLRNQRFQAIALLEERGATVHLGEVDESFFEALARGALPGEDAVRLVRILPTLERLGELAGQNRGVPMIEGSDLLLNVKFATTTADPLGDFERQLETLRLLPWLRHIDVSNTPLDDQQFQRLLAHARCEVLDVSGTEITDDAFKRISRLTSLGQLSLAHANITDGALAEISKCSRLTSINLRYTKVSDNGLSHLTRLTQLKHLHLTRTAISSDGMAEVGKLTTVDSLRISGTKVTDRGLRHLHNLKNLRWFFCEGTGITIDGLEEFSMDVPAADRRQWIGGRGESRGRLTP